MAEAHQAVAFSFSVSSEGVQWNVDARALMAVLHSGLHYWKISWNQIRNRFLNGLYPARPSGWVGVVLFVFTMSVFGWDLSFGLVKRLEPLARRLLLLEPPHDNIVACFWFALIVWMTGVVLRKSILYLLLGYHGWMYEIRGPISWKTRIWNLCLMALSGSQPRLYSNQGSMPKLPLPAVKDTITRYLRSVKPLLSEEDYKHTESVAEQFVKQEAGRLQRYLWLKTWWADNYVTDWWEEYVYLHGRNPIMVNSNFYGMDACMCQPTRVVAARAANIVYGIGQYMRVLVSEEMKPIILNGIVPLCSAQYERQFCTTRIPGKGKDRLMHRRWSSHIAVYHLGRWFKCHFVVKDHFLDPAELQSVFELILKDTTPATDGEKYLGALTAGERDHWAVTRKTYFSSGMNRKSLEAIESAAFCLIFDEEEQGENSDDAKSFSACGSALLHGKCYDRWFDKSFNLIVFKNGKIGFNAEHSWADAPIMGQMWEVILWDDATHPNYGYDVKGNCRGYSPKSPPLTIPIHLKWDISPQCLGAIHQSLSVATQLADDVDLYILKHDAYGKGFMKLCKVSPDAFIQLALQLAYYRDAGHFCLTYEASMTRLFLDGRTETVRSCTMESVALVQAMHDNTKTKEEKMALFQIACEAHQQLYRDAMTGKGVDRHLFCLYVISKYLGTESAFLREVLSEPWRLSTSQTPQNQTGKVDYKRHPDFISSGGGFGPVANDGYGVSYMIAGEDVIFFHISSKVSSPLTSSKKFAEEVKGAFADLRDMLTM